MTLPPIDPNAANRAVDDALHSFPLQPAPPGLAPAVLAALRAPGSAQAARPAFRLSWMDFALSGFAALMLALVLLLAGWLTPETAARLQNTLAGPLWQANVAAWGLAVGGSLVMGGFLLLAALVFRRPQPWQRL